MAERHWPGPIIAEDRMARFLCSSSIQKGIGEKEAEALKGPIANGCRGQLDCSPQFRTVLDGVIRWVLHADEDISMLCI